MTTVTPIRRIVPKKPVALVREREILRIAGVLAGQVATNSAEIGIREVLRWAQTKAAARFPSEAWNLDSFEQLSSGRSRVAVRLKFDGTDYWAIRVEDPDKTVAGRIWTTEVVIAVHDELMAKFTTRLLVSSAEESLQIDPHVPGVVRQIINTPGFHSGPFKVVDRALTIKTQEQAAMVADALVDPRRTLPLIILTVPSDAADIYRSPLDARSLAQACAGMATVIVLPAEFTWALTDRYGKRLSVYEGAARIYLPGFTADANPFGGHELILAREFSTPATTTIALNRLRWMAANASARRVTLGKDVISFASLRLRSLEDEQRKLQKSGATERERLETAEAAIKNLKVQVEEAERYQQQFSDLHDAAEERAEVAESQLKAAGFRIQQLLEQLKSSGETPDANIPMPAAWDSFADWCDQNLAGRVILTPQVRRLTRNPEFDDVQLAARCLLWLANDYRSDRLLGGDGSMRDRVLEEGVFNAHCGNDSYEFNWQDRKYDVDWHIKNGGNTRDPRRCLRIYYFWDESSQQSVIASMPAHRKTDAS